MNDRQEGPNARYRHEDGTAKKQEQEQTVTRYRRKQDKEGETVYVRRKSSSILSYLPIVWRGRRKHGKRGGQLCAEAIMIPFPVDFRERHSHELPTGYRVMVGENEELLDRAYKRLKGLSADQLVDVLKPFSARVIMENESRLLGFSVRQLFQFLDRQYAAVGMTVLESHVG